MKIKNRWILAAVTLSVLPFLLFAGYSLVQLMQGKQQELQVQLVERTQATASAVAERLASSTSALRALAVSGAAQRGDVPAMYAQARRVVQDMPLLSAIALVNEESQVVFLTLQPLGSPPVPAGDPDTVRSIFATGQAKASSPFRSPIDNRVWITSVGVPVMRDGKVAWVLRAIFRSSSLNALLAAQHLPDEWTSAIISDAGVVQARSRDGEKSIGTTVSARALEMLASQYSGVFDSRIREGVPIKTVIVPVPGWDWNVIVGVPAALFAEPLNRLTGFLLVFGGAVLVLGVIVALWLHAALRDSRSAAGTTLAVTARIPDIWPWAVALGVAVSIGIVSTVAAQRALQQIKVQGDARQSIRIAERRLVELGQAYRTVESAQARFLARDEEAALVGYQDALAQIALLTNLVKADLDAAGVTVPNWADLAYFSSERLASANRQIEARRRGQDRVDAPAAPVEADRLLMDKVQLQLQTMSTQLEGEARRINEAIPAHELRSRQLQWLSQLTVGSLLLLSVSIWLFERRRRQAVLAQLRESNETLEDRVTARTRELATAHQRVKDFALEREALIDNERRRLSREVHDQIGQIFTGLKMIARTLRPGSLPPDQEQAMMDAIESGVRISRRIAAELRPPLLDDFGLRAALEHYLKSTFDPLGISFHLEFPEPVPLDAQQRNQLFRIVQEACTNIVRHARARHVEVLGRLGTEGLEVFTEDDGIGLDAAEARKDSLGIMGMEERARLGGARFSIEARPQGGSCVTVRYPGDVLVGEGTA